MTIRREDQQNDLRNETLFMFGDWLSCRFKDAVH